MGEQNSMGEARASQSRGSQAFMAHARAGIDSMQRMSMAGEDKKLQARQAKAAEDDRDLNKRSVAALESMAGGGSLQGHTGQGTGFSPHEPAQ